MAAIMYNTKFDSYRKASGKIYPAKTVIHVPGVIIGIIDSNGVLRSFPSMGAYWVSEYATLPVLNLTSADISGLKTRVITDIDPVVITDVKPVFSFIKENKAKYIFLGLLIIGTGLIVWKYKGKFLKK